MMLSDQYLRYKQISNFVVFSLFFFFFFSLFFLCVFYFMFYKTFYLWLFWKRFSTFWKKWRNILGIFNLNERNLLCDFLREKHRIVFVFCFFPFFQKSKKFSVNFGKFSLVFEKNRSFISKFTGSRPNLILMFFIEKNFKEKEKK